MKHRFCQETENFTRLMASVRTVETRGAGEAGWMLVMGEPGLGKSASLEYFATQQDCVHLRAKAAWTVHWMLNDLMHALGEQTARKSETLLDRACAHFTRRRDGRILIVDEIENAMHDIKVLETLRDISDLTEITVIVAGMRGVDKSLKTHPHIYSRIADICEFAPATLGDVRVLCDQLCEVAVRDDLVATLHEQSGAYHREILNGIARIEARARRAGINEIGLDDLGTAQLTNDGRRAGRAGAKRAA